MVPCTMLSEFHKITDARSRRATFLVTLALDIALSTNSAHALLNKDENANDQLGQFTSVSSDTAVDYVKACPNNGASTIGFDFNGISNGNGCNPYGWNTQSAIDATNHWLFVPDHNNHRVLVFPLNSNNTISSKTPRYVLGHSNYTACGSNDSQGAEVQWAMNHPLYLAVDSANQRLFVSDYSNNRVLVFSTSSMSNGENASYELGCTDFVGDGCGGPTQSGMNNPQGVAYDANDNWLFVVDYSNNRVLVFNVAPGTISNGENASYVLGQSNFTSNGSATTQSGLNSPANAAYDASNDRLFVSDWGNARVLVFNVASGTIANGENASYVLGQSSFTASGGNTTQSGMSKPDGLTYDATNNRLFVGEQGNSRVTVWNVAPGTIANGENASYVLGQSSFTSSTSAVTQSGMCTPSGATYDSTNSLLYVNDLGNNRVMQFNVATGTIANGENASDLLGQYTSLTSTATVTYTQEGANNGPTALGLYSNLTSQGGIAMDPVHHYLYVTDDANNRVLVYALNTDNSISTASGGHTASYVLGQTALQGANSYGQTQATFNQPMGLAIDTANQRLFTVDFGNNRVLVFPTSSLSNGENASYVLGASNFTSSGYGDTQHNLENPEAVAYDSVNQLLYVADSGNNRVLVFNVAPGTIANGENASYVLGQSSYTTQSSGHTASKMHGPSSLAFDPVNNRLFVGDGSNCRVLVFNTASIATGMSASYALGQSSTSADSCSGSGLANIAGNPSGLAYDATSMRLFVFEGGNNRVMTFNVGPSVIATGESAISLTLDGEYEVTQNGFEGANALYYDVGSGRLFLQDSADNRIMIFEASTNSTNTQHGITPGYD
jgi:DNA-binding beta-propeller fold protein YncE